MVLVSRIETVLAHSIEEGVLHQLARREKRGACLVSTKSYHVVFGACAVHWMCMCMHTYVYYVHYIYIYLHVNVNVYVIYIYIYCRYAYIEYVHHVPMYGSICLCINDGVALHLVCVYTMYVMTIM